MSFLSKYQTSRTFNIFLVVWIIVNLLQSGFTDLNNDEAYYWMYSRYLDWGYFDHPPMIALMIKSGYLLCHNELGVRLLTVIFMALSLVFLWCLTDETSKKNENVSLFILLAIILPVFNIYGFIATPDSPLIFFSVLFLLAYKRFIENESWRNTLFISLTMAAMMYSKYHAALMIIFVILSNPELLRKPKFYYASILAFCLFIPHIVWQFANDFPTFRYHLVDRASGIHPGNILEYFGNLLAFQNPVILPVAIWLTLKKRPESKFDRSLYFILYGFILFFLAESLRYSIQPQWTSLLAIPVIIIVFRAVSFYPVTGRIIKWTAYVMLPLIIIARTALAVDFLPVKYLKDEFHDYKKRVREIASVAGDRPVVFTNSYQDPSVYSFYTGNFAHSLDNLNYRRTQYDLWNFEEKIHGREVLYVPHWPTTYIQNNFTKHYFFNGDSVYMRIYNDFQSLQKECVILKDEHYNFREKSINDITMEVFDPYPYPMEIKHKEFPIVFQINFFRNGKREERWNLQLPDSISKINPGDTISVDCRFSLGELSDTTYKIVICSEVGVLYDAFNSRFREATILK
jgi:hypothetical protein